MNDAVPEEAIQMARNCWEKFYSFSRELKSQGQVNRELIEDELIKPIEESLELHGQLPSLFSIACRNMLAWGYGQTGT